MLRIEVSSFADFHTPVQAAVRAMVRLTFNGAKRLCFGHHGAYREFRLRRFVGGRQTTIMSDAHHMLTCDTPYKTDATIGWNDQRIVQRRNDVNAPMPWQPWLSRVVERFGDFGGRCPGSLYWPDESGLTRVILLSQR